MPAWQQHLSACTTVQLVSNWHCIAHTSFGMLFPITALCWCCLLMFWLSAVLPYDDRWCCLLIPAGLGACYMVKLAKQPSNSCNVKHPQPSQWYASSSSHTVRGVSAWLRNRNRSGSASGACAGSLVQDMQACMGPLRVRHACVEPCAGLGSWAAVGVAAQAAAAWCWWWGKCCSNAQVSVLRIAHWGVSCGRLQRAQ